MRLRDIIIPAMHKISSINNLIAIRFKPTLADRAISPVEKVSHHSISVLEYWSRVPLFNTLLTAFPLENRKFNATTVIMMK